MNLITLQNEEAKTLFWILYQKDETCSGDLKMDDIRQAYALEYCAALISREDIDTLLSKCTVQVNKRGMIRYSQFI